MPKWTSKGTKLQLSIASVFTDIPAIDSLQAPEAQPETTETTALDSGVGKEHKPTGYAEGGQCSGSLFIDPAGTVHKALTALLAAPALASWKIIWSDTGATTWPFSGTLAGFAGVTAKVGEFLKTNFNIQLDGLVTYPA